MDAGAPSWVIGEAYRLRAAAEKGPIGKRRSSFELYELLADVMSLAERCRTGNHYEELRALIAQQPHEGNRRYAERNADSFTLVARFTWGNLKTAKAERSNAFRYASAMREAHKSGIKAKALAAYLRENGGINALFLARPLDDKVVSTKTLYLTAPITVAKGKSFSLRLKRLDDNRYEVLSHES